MKDTVRVLAILIGVIILAAELAYSKDQTLPLCQLQDSISKQNPGFKLQLSDLPKVVFVARESVQEILGPNSLVISHQSFVSAKSKVECAKTVKGEQKNYSLLAPVLIDLSDDQKTKNSYWQFQSMLYDHKLGIWNQKAKLLKETLSLEEWLKSQSAEVEFYQSGHQEIMMQIRQKEKDHTLVQRIYFDQL